LWNQRRRCIAQRRGCFVWLSYAVSFQQGLCFTLIFNHFLADIFLITIAYNS
jgi:hypothetical protein